MRQALLSVMLFALLFVVLYGIEWFFPAVRGQLLRWGDGAFVVGIPASVVGVAYVLTIRDPRNYMGFYGGIVMALLLATQFALQGNWDLVVLQLCVFIPFGLISLVRWRRAVSGGERCSVAFMPGWLSWRSRIVTWLIALVLVLVDYVLVTRVLQCDGWCDGVLLKLMGGVMIASSVLANFLLINKEIDAWLWWVLYSASGIVFYLLLGNMFSLVLFAVFLLVNGSAGVSWIRMYIRQ